VQFRVDRPFIYMIQDPTTNTILFAGRVLNPAG
jgi:serine protease inhibitor